jgi:two-component system sensor histidine kinase RstB/two-component system sensor kinase ParS
MALLWTWPFWSQLRKIDVSARAFGTGDFSVRVKLSKRSALISLAHSFNDMAERIQQLINSHKELTRAVSHELRTPISRIRFSLEMTRTAIHESDRLNYLAEIDQDVDELDELVSELLTYTRFERENPVVNLEELCIASWLDQTVKETRIAVSRTAVSCCIAPEAESVVSRIATFYMARAVRNLIINAQKYATTQVVVSLEKENQRCLIHIDDDGPGIPAADRERIFEPFVRLDVSRAKETGGYGLGLAIVRQIVSLHHGQVWTEPSPLGGARFTISWAI